MEILIAIHRDEYPTRAYEVVARLLNRFADHYTDLARLLDLVEELDESEANGSYDAAILRDLADALEDVARQGAA